MTSRFQGLDSLDIFSHILMAGGTRIALFCIDKEIRQFYTRVFYWFEDCKGLFYLYSFHLTLIRPLKGNLYAIYFGSPTI